MSPYSLAGLCGIRDAPLPARGDDGGGASGLDPGGEALREAFLAALRAEVSTATEPTCTRHQASRVTARPAAPIAPHGALPLTHGIGGGAQLCWCSPTLAGPLTFFPRGF